jgi:hypothetical protein
MADARNVRIESASRKQETLLREILAGLGETAIAHVRLEPFDRIAWDEYEELGVEPPPEEVERNQGVALVLVEPAHPDLRTHWELTLAGHAFCQLSADLGLTRVVWIEDGQAGSAIDVPDVDPRQTLTREEIECTVQGAAARAGAILDRFEILEPHELAVAVTLAVPEPHAFLRHGLGAFLELVGHGHGRYFGSFVRIVDGAVEPVWESGHYRYGGMSRQRADVACCAPYRGGFLDDPGPPPCPVTARTWAEAFAAFRDNLGPSTGRRLDEWLDLLAAAGLETPSDRYDFLRRRHGLGEASVVAIVDVAERAP